MKEKKSWDQELISVFKMIYNDVISGGLIFSLKQDLQDIYEFYLDYESRRRLAKMNVVRRSIYIVCWYVKSLFSKLHWIRRILVFIALFCLYKSQSSLNYALAAAALLFIILSLELKDKLLFRDELEAGRVVQSALMPQKQPYLEGWDLWLYTNSANEVGGDLVDYLEPAENRLGLALGDVAGKGLGAALVAAKLQATLRALALYHSSLKTLGRRMNEIFYRDGLPNRFVTLVYLELEPLTGRLRILNAGHMPPVLVSLEITEMDKGGPALGLSRDAEYHEEKLVLQPDEMLVVYSDGLTEAVNEDGEFFGENRLYKLMPELRNLSAEKAGEKIVKTLQYHVGSARRTDDLSLLIVKRNPDLRIV
ncbi:serine/threonine-protein phosphatase [candidate division KSB1 bacterium]|nr:serine/threonine-protein phosphatase [candidate division KSB1 bacterium]